MQELYFKIILGTSFLIIFTLGFQSCSEVFENDISGACVDVIIPSQGDSVSINNVHFKWEEVDGATRCKIQLVSPSFTNIQTYHLDSLIEGTEYYYNLTPGHYQWQIRAENSAYQGQYCEIYDLFIDSVTDLSNQIIALNAPNDGIYSNQDDYTFSWTSHYAADSYEFDLVKGTVNGASISHQTGIVSPFAQVSTSLVEDQYYWKVRAVNSTSVSQSSNRILYIDKTNPNASSLINPLTNSSYSDTVLFQWNLSTDIGTIQSPVKSIIQVSTDTLFSSIFYTDSLYSDSLEVVFNTNTNYFWRILNRDDAGNASTYSEVRKFTIN